MSRWMGIKRDVLDFVVAHRTRIFMSMWQWPVMVVHFWLLFALWNAGYVWLLLIPLTGIMISAAGIMSNFRLLEVPWLDGKNRFGWRPQYHIDIELNEFFVMGAEGIGRTFSILKQNDIVHSSRFLPMNKTREEFEENPNLVEGIRFEFPSYKNWVKAKLYL